MCHTHTNDVLFDPRFYLLIFSATATVMWAKMFVDWWSWKLSHVDGNVSAVGPSFANASDTTASLSKPKLFSALASSWVQNLSRWFAALFGVNVKIGDCIGYAFFTTDVIKNKTWFTRWNTYRTSRFSWSNLHYVLLIFYVFSCRLQRDLCGVRVGNHSLITMFFY